VVAATDDFVDRPDKQHAVLDFRIIDGAPWLTIEDQPLTEGAALQLFHGRQWHWARVRLNGENGPRVHVLSAAWPDGPKLVEPAALSAVPARLVSLLGS
jgi:hypothetical protein